MVEHNQSSYYNNGYKFNGKDLDEATGMYYYGTRYYDPRISIFISVDPLAEQTMTPYQYVKNNPIMFIDPTGMIWEKPEERDGLKKDINNKIESLQSDINKSNKKIAKGKLNEEKLSDEKNSIIDKTVRIENLYESLNDIDRLEKDKNTYSLYYSERDDLTASVTKSKNTVYIRGVQTDEYIHEITHIVQSLNAGGLEFDDKTGKLKNSGTTIVGTAENEIEAYQRQYSYGGSTAIDMRNVKSINDVNATNINKYKKKKDGSIAYPSMLNKIRLEELSKTK